MKTIDKLRIVFDGPPGPVAGRFIECEDAEGQSVRIGEWVQDSDEQWALEIDGSFIVNQPVIADAYSDEPWEGVQIVTREYFQQEIEFGNILDEDGFFYPSRDGKIHAAAELHPSDWPEGMPDDATHVAFEHCGK